jgi:hypothetical protein
MARPHSAAIFGFLGVILPKKSPIRRQGQFRGAISGQPVDFANRRRSLRRLRAGVVAAYENCPVIKSDGLCLKLLPIMLPLENGCLKSTY